MSSAAQFLRISVAVLGYCITSAQSSCTGTGGETGATSTGSEYVLVWKDDFDGFQEGLADAVVPVCTDLWFHQTMLPNEGWSWYNGEVQHYTNRTENSYQQNGLLHITARKETFSSEDVTKEYTSARLNMKFAFTYGRVDVRALLPTSGMGSWPAIWTLGQNVMESGGYWFEQNYGSVHWPACGEIDIMEKFDFKEATEINAVTLTGAQNSDVTGNISLPTYVEGSVSVPTYDSEYHVYSMIWEKTQIQFLVDDVVFHTFVPPVWDSTHWPFFKPQYMILNVAMGGFGGGEVDPNFSEATMMIDYVNLYQQAQAPATAAPTPMDSETDVISLYSNYYTNNVVVDTWLTGWSGEWGNDFVPPTYEDYEVEGQVVKKYSYLGFAGVETLSQKIDASIMDAMHLDVWTADCPNINIKLVNIDDSGNTQEAEVTAKLFPFEWNSVHLPMSVFAEGGLTSTSHLSQYVFQVPFEEGPCTVFMDNMYFSFSTSPAPSATASSAPSFSSAAPSASSDSPSFRPTATPVSSPIGVDGFTSSAPVPAPSSNPTVTASSSPTVAASSNPTVTASSSPTTTRIPPCCSLNFGECIGWCGNTQETCERCNSDVVWLASGAPPEGTCLARWEDCTQEGSTGCCPGLVCASSDSSGVGKCTYERDSCCTIDFSRCIDYCGSTETECAACGSNFAWLVHGIQRNQCLRRWYPCTNDINGCCEGLSCVPHASGYLKCDIAL